MSQKMSCWRGLVSSVCINTGIFYFPKFGGIENIFNVTLSNKELAFNDFLDVGGIAM